MHGGNAGVGELHVKISSPGSEPIMVSLNSQEVYTSYIMFMFSSCANVPSKFSLACQTSLILYLKQVKGNSS